ncbi:SEC-C metal-binding domain-containing protein [Streptomyces sp. NPDC052693]|uniref:SEC-C metal-binding domain-containing protein n=1 Tax=Streptomyces sp. NPDC052693 TaxID=3155814 RepID=UPI003420201E
MPERTFLTNEQLDHLLATMPGPDTLPVSTRDQLQAATRENGVNGQSMALAAVAAGGWALLGKAPKDTGLLRRMVKPRLRMLLAAFSAGTVTRLCEHTMQIRPVIVLCDPPTIVCTQPACIARLSATRETAQFLWDHQCDCCGKHSEIVTPHLAGFGPVNISGHLCAECTDMMAATSLEAADGVEVVTRKSPCPCGSGRRFKRCHGRGEAA